MSTGKNILLVDDEPDLLKIVVFRLRRAGYEVGIATSGRGALDKVGDVDYDLILLDLGLPDIDGAEVCKTLKDPRSGYGHIPVIVFTATIEEIEDTYREIGADDYVTKPFDLSELLDKIKQCIG